ncbi:transcription initiation factor TFIID subunit 4 isoform X2 [Pungitius pungitius]|uniref:transcription initiation factor TFIID subunit 4 isoform X2 n=1 Tax=Pungitius pungitius TaxID=134920 RepID=UPI002E0E6543
MAGASDPLEDMLFSEVDEKAVSDLVGSLESQLAGQSNLTGKADENGGAGSVAPANHHLGKTLPAPVGTTTLAQQQQGRRNKPEMPPEINSKDASPDTAAKSPSPDSTRYSGEPPAAPAACAGATSASGSRSHGASITTLAASGASTLASAADSISTASVLGSKVSPGSCGSSSEESNPPRKRIGAPRRSASTRVKSLNGAAVTTRRNSGTAAVSQDPSAAETADPTTPNSTRPAASSINTSTFTVSNADLPAGQSAIALDRGTPTIALRRLPSHIVASIAQTGSGTSVSALAQQGARVGPAAPPSTSRGDHSPDDRQSKTVPPSQPASSVNSVISTVSAVVTTTTTTTTAAAAAATPSAMVTRPASSAAAAAGVAGPAASSACVTGQVTSVATAVSMVRPSLPSPTPAAQVQPRPGLAAPQRIAAPQVIIRPPQQPTTIQLPPGFTIPPGMVLVRTELGQLVMVPQQALAQAQAQAQAQALNNISPRPATPTAGASFRVTTPQKAPVAPAAPAAPAPATQQTPAVAVAPQAPAPAASQPTQLPQTSIAANPASQEMQENVKKCKNFLATLIKLASHNSPSPETSKNVKSLVQDLLDAKIEPEEFTSRLQTELKSSPQPYLVPFLKKSLPALRLSLMNSQQSPTPSQQQGVKPPPCGAPPTLASGPAVRARHPNSVSITPGAGAPPAGAPGHAAAVGIKAASTAGGPVRMPMVISQSVRTQGTMGKGGFIQAGRSPVGPAAAQICGNQRNKLNDPGGGSFRDDDDINDVASMAGVNLNEESARILATNSELVGTHIRSCKDEAFLHPGLLHRRILETARKFGVTEVPMEAVTFISHAAQARLRTVVEKVSTIAQHRLDSCKDDECYEQSADARSQLRFFEQLERMEKQRKDEQEREILLKAAKSRSRQEDPEQARLKQKAKEMQQQELAQMRQRDANLTALAAIGPRKKRKVDSPGTTPPGAEVSGSAAGSPAASSSPSTSSRQYARQRITRVNLRDLIFYMEQERETAHSLLLYRALLK